MSYVLSATMDKKEKQQRSMCAKTRNISWAASMLNKAIEEEKGRVSSYRTTMIKSLLFDDILEEVKQSGTDDMYQIVEILSDDYKMAKLVSSIQRKIEEFDSNPDNDRKINPTNINLVKTIEHFYKIYMTEFLVREEVRRMCKKGMPTAEIISVLNPEKRAISEERNKSIRLSIRSVVGTLWGVPEEECKSDKLRTELRDIMKSIAREIYYKEQQRRKSGSNMETSDR